MYSKIHMVFKGVGQKTMFVHKGRGGSKMSKNLSTWFMNDPYGKIHFLLYFNSSKVIKQDLLLLLLCCCTILRPSVSRKKTCEVMKFFNFLGSKRFPNYPSTMYSVGLSSCIIIFMFTLGFLELLV